MRIQRQRTPRNQSTLGKLLTLQAAGRLSRGEVRRLRTLGKGRRLFVCLKLSKELSAFVLVHAVFRLETELDCCRGCVVGIQKARTAFGFQLPPTLGGVDYCL